MNHEHLQTDVLVIGGGLAALRAAIEARAAGARVLAAVKGQFGRSGCSAMTTAGYAAVLSQGSPGDSHEAHGADTLRAGAGLGDRRLIDVMCSEAEEEVNYLERLGVRFKKYAETYHLSPSGDHSRARVLVTINDIGTDLTLPLLRQAERLGVGKLEFVSVIELLRDDAGVCGAVCVGTRDTRIVTVSASAIVLATGGAGRLFSITSNPRDVTGDGYVLAARAGAELRDMEFIQFYPWRCIDLFPRSRISLQPSTFVLGARLYNSRGDRFMASFNPDGAEITTRDVAARGIFDQIRNGLGVDGGVRADLSSLSKEDFVRSNPRLSRHLEAMKIDHRTHPFIVGPEAHYFMGGVAIDETGATSIDGLFAAGEVSGGVHGANRINSNSLPEAQVFGARAGRAAAETRRRARRSTFAASAAKAIGQLSLGGEAARAISATEVSEHEKSLREKMWASVGIIRNAAAMRSGLDYVQELRAEMAARRPEDTRTLRSWLDLLSLCGTAELCLTGALARQESRGAHYREDFPSQDNETWKCSLFLRWQDEGSITMRTGS